MIINNKATNSIIDIIESALENEKHLFENLTDLDNDNIFFNELTKQVFTLTDAEIEFMDENSPYYGFCFNINADIYNLDESPTKTELYVNIANNSFSGTKKEYVIYQLKSMVQKLYKMQLVEKKNQLIEIHKDNLKNASYRLIFSFTQMFKLSGYVENISWLNWLSTHYKSLDNAINAFNEIVYTENSQKEALLDHKNIIKMIGYFYDQNLDDTTKNNISAFIKKNLYTNPKQIAKFKNYKNDDDVKKVIFNYIENNQDTSLSRVDKISFLIGCKELDVDNQYTTVLKVTPMVKLSKAEKINSFIDLKIVYDLDDLSFLNSRTNILKYIDEIKKLNQIYMLKNDFIALTKIKEAYELINFTMINNDSQYKTLLNELTYLIDQKKLVLINSISDLSDKKLIISTLTD